MHIEYLIQMDVSMEECFNFFSLSIYSHILNALGYDIWRWDLRDFISIKQDIQVATAWSQQTSQKKAYIVLLHRSSWPFPAMGVKEITE